MLALAREATKSQYSRTLRSSAHPPQLIWPAFGACWGQIVHVSVQLMNAERDISQNRHQERTPSGRGSVRGRRLDQLRATGCPLFSPAFSQMYSRGSVQKSASRKFVLAQHSPGLVASKAECLPTASVASMAKMASLRLAARRSSSQCPLAQPLPACAKKQVPYRARTVHL